MKRVHIFVLAVVLSLALMYFSYLPALGILGQVLLLFSTLAHEMGHAAMAVLFGGDLHELVIRWDGSGHANSSIRDSRIIRGLVAAGGLIGPSITAALLFWSARRKDKVFLLVTRLFALTLLVVGVVAARSVWALIFTLGLGAVLLALSFKVGRPKLESLVVFIGVQLGLSVFTRADYLFTRWAGPNLPSDVAQMSQALFLPYWFWGLICGLFSVVVLAWGCRCYIKN